MKILKESGKSGLEETVSAEDWIRVLRRRFV
jgi:hypothetical protein